MVSCLDGLLRDDWAGGCGPAGMWPPDVTPPSSRRTRPMSCTGVPLVPNPANSLKPGGAFQKFEIDLDLPPDQRWRHVYESEWVRGIIEKVGEWYKNYMESQVQLPYNQKLLKSVDASLDDDLKAEIRSIGDLIGMTYMQVLASNVRVESYTTFGCSAVLAAKDDGTVVLGKCYDMMPKGSDMMMDLVFTKGGKKLFSAVGQHLTHVGVHTGMRFGGFACTHNTSMRTMRDSPEDRLQVAANGGRTSLLEYRRLLETVDDYDTLVDRLRNTKWVATQHLTFAGTTKGCVLTTSPVDPPRFNHLDPASGRWFLYQSNDDWWKPSIDNRRKIAVRHLTKMGRHNVSEESIFAVLQQSGLNHYFTDFICACTPAEGTSRIMHGYEAPNRKSTVVCSTLATCLPRTTYVVRYEMNGGITDYNGYSGWYQKAITTCVGPLQLLFCSTLWKEVLQKLCLKD